MSQYILIYLEGMLSLYEYVGSLFTMYVSKYVSGLWLDKCKDRIILDRRKSNAVSETTRVSCTGPMKLSHDSRKCSNCLANCTVSRSSSESPAPGISRVTRAVVTPSRLHGCSWGCPSNSFLPSFHILPKFDTVTVVLRNKVTMTLAQLRCGACQPPANESSCTLISHRRHAQLPLAISF